MAQDNVKSLVAFEYGYLGTTTKTYGTAATRDDGTLNTFGIKLGAEEGSYRLFLSYRLLYANGTDLGHSAGAELEYMIHLGNLIGLYFGAVAGYATYDYTGTDAVARQLKSPYVGGDVGTVFTLGSFEIDVGTRLWNYLNGAEQEVTSQTYIVKDALTYFVAFHYYY